MLYSLGSKNNNNNIIPTVSYNCDNPCLLVGLRDYIPYLVPSIATRKNVRQLQ